MKIHNKIIISSILILVFFINEKVFASDIINYIKTEENYTIPKTNFISKNPLNIASLIESNLLSKYTLQNIIPDNMIIRDQKNTNSCWTFSSLAMLETNLAIKNYIDEKPVKIYDFSERHMEYSTSRLFKYRKTNKLGFNRTVGSGGGNKFSIPYLTNGLGAIDEKEMPFEDNEDMIDISEIQGKKTATQVFDTISFPTYNSSDDLSEIIKSMKNHIKLHGGIEAEIHGDSPISEYINNKTGAIYCDSKEKAPIDHEVLIIGWDDNYSKNNFTENHRPQNNGAWIAKNSWGTRIEYTIDEIKKRVFESATKNQKQNLKWNSESDIPDELITNAYTKAGFSLNDNKLSLDLANNGYIYISYDDINVYTKLTGIEKAEDHISYDNLYQYNALGVQDLIEFSTSKVYLANKFQKKTNKKEYLTQISLTAPEAYTCKVYVNPNGESISQNDLVQVQLKSGNSESFNSGYHTIEFLKPIELSSDKYAVVVEIQGTRKDSLSISTEIDIEGTYTEGAKIEDGKCFLTVDDYIKNNEWIDMSKLYDLTDGAVQNADSSIKAFTINSIDENNYSKPINTINNEWKSTVKEIKTYYFTDTTQKEYMKMRINLSNTKIETNNNYEYYLSSNPLENNITQWLKIKWENNSEFTIDTRDINNLSELLSGNELYLYIKENEQISAIPLELDGNILIYEDNKLKKDNNIDTTISNNIFPYAGIKYSICALIYIVIIFCIITYLKIKNSCRKMKTKF